MNELQKIMNLGIDVNLILIGDKSTYYVYLSSVIHGEFFLYGYGRTLEESIESCFRNLEKFLGVEL